MLGRWFHCVLLSLIFAGCSSDSGPQLDASVDGTAADQTVDQAATDTTVDTLIPIPDVGGPAPDGPTTDAIAPDTMAPDTITPDTMAPDTVTPDTMAPDTVTPDTVAPDSATADTMAPDTVTTDTIAPDATFDATLDTMADLAPDGTSGGPSATCAQAPLVTLGSTTTTLSGDTSLLTDEFASLDCKATGTTQLSGPQAYYRLKGTAGQWYKLVLTPTFDFAYFYVFTSSACTATAIEADCQSNGATGTASRSIKPGQSQAIYFKAPASGEFTVAVDGLAPSYSGPFDLTIAPIARPTNGTCATAEPLTLQSGVATAQGDIGVNLTPDEMPTLACDGPTTAKVTMKGPQAYYTFAAQAGTSYTIEVTADAAQFLSAYVVRQSCVLTEIAADCSSGGSTGDYIASSIKQGDAGTIDFTAATAGTYLIAVDSGQVFNYGGYTLKVTEVP